MTTGGDVLWPSIVTKTTKHQNRNERGESHSNMERRRMEGPWKEVRPGERVPLDTSETRKIRKGMSFYRLPLLESNVLGKRPLPSDSQ